MAGYKKNMAQYENLEGWEKLSLGMQLDKWAIRYGNRIAVTDSEEEITYSELNQKAIGTGQYFMEKGIQKGDKVLVQLPNRISFVVVLFALAKIGAVPIMMLPAHRETELESFRRNLLQYYTNASSVVGLPNPRETRCIVFKLGLFARIT